VTKDGKGMNSQLDYTVNSLKLQNQDMGSGKLTLKWITTARRGTVQPAIQREARRCWRMPQLAQNPELYQQALTETVQCAADPAERQPVGDHCAAELAQRQRRNHL
jgi:uncharacterized protein YdgA (DUF945 family)